MNKKSTRVRIKPLDGGGRPGPAGKQIAILKDLRQRIINGSHGCGSRMPTRSELKRAYGVSGLTVQWALSRLAEDGFVVAQGSRGTFVSDTPPHLRRIGLVLAGSPQISSTKIEGGLSHLLLRQFMALRERDADRFQIYGNLGSVDGGDWPRLADDIVNARLAGVFCESPYLPSRGVFYKLLQEQEFPCVAMGSGSYGYEPLIKRLVADHRTILSRAMEVLAQRGCRRIAVIDSTLTDRGSAMLCQLAESCNLTLARAHILGVPADLPYLARPIAELLLSTQPRIDGLIVADDSLVEQATLGLVDAGVNGSGLHVVAHANFPLASPCAVAARRIGIDLRQALSMAIDLVLSMRRGQWVEEITRLPVLLDDEVSS